MTRTYSSRKRLLPNQRDRKSDWVALAAHPPVSLSSCQQNNGGQAASATRVTSATRLVWTPVVCALDLRLCRIVRVAGSSRRARPSDGEPWKTGRRRRCLHSGSRSAARRRHDLLRPRRGIRATGPLGRCHRRLHAGHRARCGDGEGLQQSGGRPRARAAFRGGRRRFQQVDQPRLEERALVSKPGLWPITTWDRSPRRLKTTPSRSASTPAILQNRFERGNVYLDAGDYAKAIADYDQAIILDAKQASVWLNRGRSTSPFGPRETVAGRHRTRRGGSIPIRSRPNGRTPFPRSRWSLTPCAPVSDVGPRQERAVVVAAEFLRSQGYTVEKSPARNPFPLVGRKGKQKVSVRVQSPADGEPLRFTRDDLDQMSRPSDPTALVVVGKLTPPASPGQPFTGGSRQVCRELEGGPRQVCAGRVRVASALIDAFGTAASWSL